MFKWLRKILRKKKPYAGLWCDLCGKRIKGGTKGLHLINEHPALGIKRRHVWARNKDDSVGYWRYTCPCGIHLSSPKSMIDHIKEVHPEYA